MPIFPNMPAHPDEDPQASQALTALQRDLITKTQRGYPFLVAGATYLYVLALAPAVMPMETVRLMWVVGIGSIFPSALLIGKGLGIDLMAPGNPLARLGGMAAGIQIFFIPVYIMVYQQAPAWLPFTIGLLGGAHFLVYAWLYDSRAYLGLTIATTLFAMIAGGWFIEAAYTIVPFGLALIYTATVVALLRENRRH